ncbi:MAG: branched-chain amino acid ABC transporter permease, partial [Vicinamibacteria bacterium]
LSIVMIYRSTRVLSFAQGAVASLATYVYFQTQTLWGWTPLIALPLALGAAALIGVGGELAVVRPLRRADTLTRTVATLGLVLVLQVIMRVVWGGDESFVRPLIAGNISIGGFTIGYQLIIIAIVAIAAAAGLGAWTKSSYRGLGLSAMAEGRDAARLLGVNPNQAALITWAIAAVLAALAGILYTPLLVLNPWQMTLIMVTGLGAALLGGFMSLPLALVGGVLIGMVQSIATGYINVSGLSETFGFIIVFAVLLMARRRGSLVSGGAEA